MPFDPIRLALACTDGAMFERRALDSLAESLGFDAAFFAANGAPPTTRRVDPRALERAFQTHAYDDELAPLKQSALARSGVAVDTDVLGPDRVRTMAYFRDFAAPMGGRHTLMAYLMMRGRPLGALMLGRCQRGFSGAEVDAIEGLLPQLTVARASFHAPWFGGALPGAAAPLCKRALAWARGEHTVARVEDASGSIAVVDRGGYREMVAARGDEQLVWTRARLDDPRRSGWFYVDLFHLAAARARRRSSALFIGCGGAVGVRQFAEVYPGMSIDLVDIDPRVVDLARDWFGLGSIPQLTIHVGDGAALVRGASDRRWDVVIVDAYDAATLPPSLASRAFFSDVRRVLRPGGCAAFNVIGALGGEGALQRMQRAASTELDDVRLVPVLDPGERYRAEALRNVVILASREP